MELHHIAISVTDLDGSIKFYIENFGFKFVKRYTKKEWNGNAALLKQKGIELELFNFNNYIKNKDSFSDLTVIGIKHIAFKVKNIEKEYNRLKSRNVSVSKPKKGVICRKFCFITDPDGIQIELYEK